MTFWQLIRLIPQILRLIKQIEKGLADLQEQRKENDAQKLQDAKTEKEVKDAAKDYLNH